MVSEPFEVVNSVILTGQAQLFNGQAQLFDALLSHLTPTKVWMEFLRTQMRLLREERDSWYRVVPPDGFILDTYLSPIDHASHSITTTNTDSSPAN